MLNWHFAIYNKLDCTMDASILDTTLKAIGLVAAVLCLYDGTKRIRKYGVSSAAIITVAIGLSYVGVHAGYSVLSTRFVNETVAMLSNGATVPRIADSWGKDFSPQDRFEKSYFLAKTAYYEHGEIRQYFNRAGEKVWFSPSQEQTRERENKVADLAKLSYVAELNSNTALQWGIIAVAAALIGFVTGRKKLSLSNTKLDSDDRVRRSN